MASLFKKLPKQLVCTYVLIMHLVYPVLNIFEIVFWRDYSRETLLVCISAWIALFIISLLNENFYNKLLKIIFSDTLTNQTNLIMSGMQLMKKYPNLSAIFMSSPFLLQFACLCFHDFPIIGLLVNLRIGFTTVRNILFFPALGYIFLIYWNEFNNIENQDQFTEYSFLHSQSTSQTKTTVENTKLFKSSRDFYNASPSNFQLHLIRNYSVIATAIMQRFSVKVMAGVAARSTVFTTGGFLFLNTTVAGYEANHEIDRLSSEVKEACQELKESGNPALKDAALLIHKEIDDTRARYYREGGSGPFLIGVNRIMGSEKVYGPLVRADEMQQAIHDLNRSRLRPPQEQLAQIDILLKKYNLTPPPLENPVVPSIIEDSWFSALFFLNVVFNH